MLDDARVQAQTSIVVNLQWTEREHGSGHMMTTMGPQSAYHLHYKTLYELYEFYAESKYDDFHRDRVEKVIVWLSGILCGLLCSLRRRLISQTSNRY